MRVSSAPHLSSISDLSSLLRRVSVRLGFASVLLALAFGCGGDDSGDGTSGTGGSGSGGETSSGGNGSGTGGGTSDGECLRATDLEEVLPLVELPSGAPIRYVASDGEYVYFSGFRNIYRIPVSGGEHEALWDGGESAMYIPFFLRDTDLVVVRGTTLLSVPKAGGDPTELASLPDRPYGALDGRVDFILDGDVAYFKSESGLGPYEIKLYSVNLTDGESTLLTTTELGHGSLLAKSGDALFIRDTDPDAPEPEDEFEVQPSALYAVPISGGDPERVSVTFEDERSFNFGPLGGDASSVFLTARGLRMGDDDFGAARAGGLFQVPNSGGTAVRLAESFQFLNLQADHRLRGERSFFRLADAVERIYSLQGGDFEELFCLNDSVYAMNADDEYVYLAISPDDSDVSAIVRARH